MGSSAPEPPRGGATDGADPPGAAGDLLTEAAAELYGTDPQEFTGRRKALAAAAKAAGDGEAAKRIAALRKPTRAAWVVNRLARHDTAAPARLAGLAAALRAAEEASDGPRLRELSAARGPLIDAMTAAALAAADVADPPSGLRDEVTATLTATLADPEVAAAFAAGTLTRGAEWAGFGMALSEAPGPGALDGAPPVLPGEGGRRLRDQRRDKEAPAARESLPEPRKPRDGRAGQVSALLEERREREEHRAGQTRQRRERLAEESARRLAEEAAQVADRRRKIFEDTERAVASAVAAAADAVAVEDRLEVEVRDLEERLTRARAELADARLQARRAEAAERKARRALEHLPRPDL